jgi:uncharacterized repeat protein (TIGR03803 family)
MRCKTLSIGLRTILTIFSATLFVTSAWASSNQKALHSFGHGTDGTTSDATLVFDAAGNLYGTTIGGGIHNYYGTVFELMPKEGGGWTEKVLHSFDLTDGSAPVAGVIFDGAGNLYGTTYFGGIHGYGTVFELTPNQGGGWTEKVLHSFNLNGSDGVYPVAGLTFDAAGNLYGTTSQGGIHTCPDTPDGCGTVFELTPKEGGGWTEQVLHSFGNGRDGTYPYGGVILDAAGNLYGTTFWGGDHGVGTVFELTPKEGGGWTDRRLHSFVDNEADGKNPRTRLIFDAAGNLYGTTYAGGFYSLGTAFELTPNGDGSWTQQFQHHFDGSNGANPFASLILDAAGNLYGTTALGGVEGNGTVFELLPKEGGGWTEKVHSFNDFGLDGAGPECGLIFDAAGNLYGTTQQGGIHSAGTVFEMAP